ncbi:hypothetical protein RQP46_003392 [Phenoliferia psychrophenolica]
MSAATRTNYDPSDPGAYDSPALPPPPTSVASRFVTETSIEAAKAQREADWKAAYERLGEKPPEKDESEPYDGRSLWEKLQEKKDTKQAAFDEQIKFKNQFRALDEDEISFLDSLTDDNHEEEAKKEQAIKDQLKSFRDAVISRQSIAPVPIIASTASVSPSASTSTLPKATGAPLPPVKKSASAKKKDFQKKFLAGVVVKKKPAGVKRSVSDAAAEASKGDEKDGAKGGEEAESGEAKKRKVDEGEP